MYHATHFVFGVVVVAAVAVAAVEAWLAHTALEVTAPPLTPFRWSPRLGEARLATGGHCTSASARRRLEHKNALAAASQNHSELRVRANTAPHSSSTFPAT